MDFTGSSWSGPAILAAKIKGVKDKLEGPVAFDLDFGPQADPLLGANEFLLILDDGIEELRIAGTWSLDEKGRPVLVIDGDALADELLELMVSICENELDLGNCDVLSLLDVEYPKGLRPKLKARSKDGLESLSMSGKLAFDLLYQGELLLSVTLGFETGDVQRD